MTIIRIKEFIGYSREDIYEFLRIHKNSFYEIILPKECSAEVDEPCIVYEYYKALYAGQLLSRISHDIFCNVPDPAKAGEFSIIIITARLKALAKLLFYFCAGYDWENNDDACVDFDVAATNVQGYMKEGEDFACWPYAEIISHLLEEEDL